MKQKLVILGSTGSVGKNTLDVVAGYPERYQVVGLTAGSNVAGLLQQCRDFKPQVVAMSNRGSADALGRELEAAGQGNIDVLSGSDALVSIASDAAVDTVMAAIVGAAGMLPTLGAVRAGKRVLVANKEPLVMAGEIFMREARRSGATILPIDSEHNAIFQCMPITEQGVGNGGSQVERIILTASGGPFRGRPWGTLTDVTPEEACAHPNWDMGKKISVDSATMMNKGLEVIEARWLFSLPVTKIDIVIHPQSVIHSMVEYRDGSVLAQLGSPDMRIPIAHALAWPERIKSGARQLDLCDIARLDFARPDWDNLPCLKLARGAALAGGGAPAILNAANEVVVGGFLDGKVAFTRIPEIIESVLEKMPGRNTVQLEDVLEIDRTARDLAARIMTHN
jgi:1-deoxy-D-xylulose-5-phosphate reductoisomerase